MSESEKPFTVSDRRHFKPDGRPRDAAEHEPRSASVPKGAEVSEEESAPERPAAEAGPSAPGEAPPAPEASSARAGEADFSRFLLSLGAEAGMLLSEESRPDGMSASEALAGARSMIGILEMLRTKTEGRRTSEEDQVLEGLLYELRMAYVEASQASAS